MSRLLAGVLPGTLIAFAGSLLAVLPAAAQSDAEAVKAALQGASAVEVKEQELSAEAKGRLSAALGSLFKPDADGKPSIGVAKDLPNPLEDPEKLPKAYAAATAAGATRLVVVAYVDESLNNRLTIADVKVLAPAPLPDTLTAFAVRLRWKGPGPASYEPLDTLAAVRKAAEAGADDTAKQNRLLLALASDMQEMDRQVDAIKAGKDEALMAKAVTTLLAKLEATNEAYAASGFVFPGSDADRKKQIENLLAQNARGIDETKGLKSAVDAKDVAKAQRRAGSLSCAKCHGLFLKPFQELRTARKIGNGYFVPGLDLQTAGPSDAAAAAEIASAARKALLLIDQAK
jgi:hypothetical protein